MDSSLNVLDEKDYVTAGIGLKTGPFLHQQWKNREKNLIPALKSKQWTHFMFGDWIYSQEHIDVSIEHAILIKELLGEYGLDEMYIMLPWSFAK